MELLVAWGVLTYLLTRGVRDAAYAITGHTPPAHEYRMERLRQRERELERRSGRSSPPPKKRGPARAYVAALWEDRWELAVKRHRERWPERIVNAERRREARRARRARRWRAIQEAARRRWLERQAREQQPVGEVPEAPNGLNPPEAPTEEPPKEKKEEDTTQPTEGSEPAPTPAPDEGSGEGTDAEVIPLRPNTKPMEVAPVSTETTGLASAITWASEMEEMARNGVNSAEQSGSALAAGNVGASVLSLTAQIQEALGSAASAACQLRAELESQQSVREAYEANPDAGNKEFVTSE